MTGLFRLFPLLSRHCEHFNFDYNFVDGTNRFLPPSVHFLPSSHRLFTVALQHFSASSGLHWPPPFLYFLSTPILFQRVLSTLLQHQGCLPITVFMCMLLELLVLYLCLWPEPCGDLSHPSIMAVILCPR